MYFLPDNPLHMFFFLQRNCHALIVVRRFFDLEGHFQLSLYCLILESGEGNDFHLSNFSGGGGGPNRFDLCRVNRTAIKV